jgi:hypothetical protein
MPDLMEELFSELGTLALFFLAMTTLLVGLPWLFWSVVRVFKWGRFHPLANQD